MRKKAEVPLAVGADVVASRLPDGAAAVGTALQDLALASEIVAGAIEADPRRGRVRGHHRHIYSPNIHNLRRNSRAETPTARELVGVGGTL